MEYLHYQLHVSASTLAIVRFVFNLSSNYTKCVVFSWVVGAGVGGMKIWILDRIANKLNTNLTMANVEAETCSW